MITNSLLTDIANAIRSKTGKNGLMTPVEMPTEIASISGGSSPTGTKQISITQNGTTTEDVASYANAEITVNVQSSTDYLAQLNNNTLTTYSDASIINVREYMFVGATNLENINLSEATILGGNSLKGCTKLKNIHFPKVYECRSLCMSECSLLETIVLPALKYANTGVMKTNPVLTAVDIGKTALTANDMYLGQQVFQNDSALAVLVLRSNTAYALQNINTFSGTPFASGGSGGTLFVPSALISNYQSATNWSTILGYANNSIQAIEGSAYETKHVDDSSL